MSHGSHFGQETAQPPFEVEQHPERSGHFVAPGLVGTSGTISSSHSIPIADSSNSTNSPGEDERINILKNLEKTIESFRGKSISKTSAVASVLRIIG